MPYVVAGTLTLPESSKPAANVTITFRNLMTVSPLIVASESSVTTSATGTYSISLQYSVYAVEVTYYNNRPISAGQILLNSETQTGLDLPTLLNGGEYEPATPAWILQIEAWLAQAQNSANASANSAQTSQSHANASAASAAASAASAAQASQISGLSTVAEAIGLAALPLPDVWAPLSDSLRMITGYGRDVLVGSDVVARMVNYWRSSTATYIGKDGLLKTAAVNEPRFEKDGLLVEGQSTNLIPTSNFPQNLAWWTAPNMTGNTYAYGLAPDGSNNALKASFSGDGLNQTIAGLVVGTAYTFSFYAKNETATPVVVSVRLGSGDNAENITIPANSAWARYSSTRTFNAGDQVLRWYFTTMNLEVWLWGCQLEALPFASSYIPTNGAAVTRAKDVLYLAPSGNVPSDIKMTFAAQIKLMGKGLNSWPRVFEISDPANKGPFIDMVTGLWGGVNIVGVRKTVAARFSDTSHWLDGVKVGSAWPPYPVKTYSEPVYIAGSNVVGSRNFYGHIRNLRAWFFSPTDDQMKAIR